MGFNLSNFNEIDMVSTAKNRLTQKVVSVATSGAEKLKNEVAKKLKTISLTAAQNKRWFGFTASEFQQKYQELYTQGQILNSNFFVEFEPYEENATANMPMLSDGLSGFLVSETSLSLLQAEFEQVKVGVFQVNQLTGISEPEVQMTFIETADARFMNSVQYWRELMVNDDGTLNPPASYAVWVTVGVFSKDLGLDYKPFSRRLLVAPSVASLDALSGQGVSQALEVPFTLVVLRNFME